MVVKLGRVEVVRGPEMRHLHAQLKRAELGPDISKNLRDCSAAVFQRSTLLPTRALLFRPLVLVGHAAGTAHPKLHSADCTLGAELLAKLLSRLTLLMVFVASGIKIGHPTYACCHHLLDE